MKNAIIVVSINEAQAIDGSLQSTLASIKALINEADDQFAVEGLQAAFHKVEGLRAKIKDAIARAV